MPADDDRRERLERAKRRNRSVQERATLLRALSARLQRPVGAEALLSLEETDALRSTVDVHQDPSPTNNSEILAVTTTSEPVAAAFVGRALVELQGAQVVVFTDETAVIGAALTALPLWPVEVLRLAFPEDTVTLCSRDGRFGLHIDLNTFSAHRPRKWTVTSWATPAFNELPPPHPASNEDENRAGAAAWAAWQRHPL